MTAAASRLVWGVKDSFLAYLARTEGSRIGVSGGAGYEEGLGFTFPLVTDADFDPGEGLGSLQFGGRVHFTGHFGMLDLLLADPRVETGPTGAELLFTVQEEDDSPALAVAALDWPTCGTAADGVCTKGGIAAALTEGAVQLFNGAYQPGEPLAPVLVEIHPSIHSRQRGHV